MLDGGIEPFSPHSFLPPSLPQPPVADQTMTTPMMMMMMMMQLYTMRARTPRYEFFAFISSSCTCLDDRFQWRLNDLCSAVLWERIHGSKISHFESARILHTLEYLYIDVDTRVLMRHRRRRRRRWQWMVWWNISTFPIAPRFKRGKTDSSRTSAVLPPSPPECKTTKSKRPTSEEGERGKERRRSVMGRKY